MPLHGLKLTIFFLVSDEISQRVYEHFNITNEQLCGSCKIKTYVDRRSVLARACYLSKGSSLGDLCRALGKHNAIVSRLATKAANTPYLAKIVEDLLLV